MDSWYRHGFMVLTTPMVLPQTQGIVSVLLNHTHKQEGQVLPVCGIFSYPFFVFLWRLSYCLKLKGKLLEIYTKLNSVSPWVLMLAGQQEVKNFWSEFGQDNCLVNVSNWLVRTVTATSCLWPLQISFKLERETLHPQIPV